MSEGAFVEPQELASLRRQMEMQIKLLADAERALIQTAFNLNCLRQRIAINDGWAAAVQLGLAEEAPQ